MILGKKIVEYECGILRLLNNIFCTISFFIRKKCKIIFFKVPAAVMYSYIDYDMISYVSDEIKKIENLSEELKNSNQFSKIDYTSPYIKILKLGWLIKELRANKMYNPVQLIKSGKSKYMCHPGIDRITVSLYINPTEFISGFYLWYPDIDSDPFILDYEHTEIKNPLVFLSKFKFSNSLFMKEARLTDQLDTISDNTTLSGFNTAKICFDKTVNQYDYRFLTFHDAEHWNKIKNKISLKDVITFKNATECDFSGILFKKINNKWVVG